jgi:N-terminal domain of reverse transcriptase/Group II intron, maturase-specific domain
MVWRESEQSSARSFMARELDQSLHAGKQMTAIDTMAQAMVIDAGAPARAEPMWLQVDWMRIGADVKRLQVRIAKATLEGSCSGKMLAVKRVTENRGKRTPGVDGRSHVVAKASFSLIDSHIWQLLWKWARGRHPAKGAWWVKGRYFHADGPRSWAFATKSPVGSDTHRLRLFRSMTIPNVQVQSVPSSQKELTA